MVCLCVVRIAGRWTTSRSCTTAVSTRFGTSPPRGREHPPRHLADRDGPFRLPARAARRGGPRERLLRPHGLRAEAAGVRLVLQHRPRPARTRRGPAGLPPDPAQSHRERLAFTPRGGQARVGAARDGDRIVLTVSDTGLGVARSDLPRLGEPVLPGERGPRRPRRPRPRLGGGARPGRDCIGAPSRSRAPPARAPASP